MDHQATVMTTVTNGHESAPAKGMTRNVSELASDVASLAELQTRLLVVDAKESVRRLIPPVVLGALGLALLLGSIPVLLMGVAQLLVYAGLGPAASLFIAFAIGALIAGLSLLAAWLLLRDSFSTFERSREEFQKNLAWIKDALKQGDRNSRTADPD